MVVKAIVAAATTSPTSITGANGWPAAARTTDRATAERIAAKMEADAVHCREGVIDPTLDAISRESRRSIESHLADYEDKLRPTGQRRESHRTHAEFHPPDCRTGGIRVGHGHLGRWCEPRPVN